MSKDMRSCERVERQEPNSSNNYAFEIRLEYAMGKEKTTTNEMTLSNTPTSYQLAHSTRLAPHSTTRVLIGMFCEPKTKQKWNRDGRRCLIAANSADVGYSRLCSPCIEILVRKQISLIYATSIR